VPRAQVTGYWDPHVGTHFAVPAVYAGVDEGEQLKRLAGSNATARVDVFARGDVVQTRNLIATLPGLSRERLILSTHTDGNTWVQENGAAGVLALADYFSRLPLKCRKRTIEFSFASGHLHESVEGTDRRAAQVDAEVDRGTLAFALGVEHLGTREIEAMPRADGPGRTLVLTGKPEQIGWFVGDSPPLIAASIDAIKRRGLTSVAVLPGQDFATKGQVPTHCSLGGIGSFFQRRLVPSIGVITGPWSLWAPGYGERAVDFGRMRAELLAAGDIVRQMEGVDRRKILGGYAQDRRLRAQGARQCPPEVHPEVAPTV
jgi:hypothetical protein